MKPRKSCGFNLSFAPSQPKFCVSWISGVKAVVKLSYSSGCYLQQCLIKRGTFLLAWFVGPICAMSRTYAKLRLVLRKTQVELANRRETEESTRKTPGETAPHLGYQHGMVEIHRSRSPRPCYCYGRTREVAARDLQPDAVARHKHVGRGRQVESAVSRSPAYAQLTAVIFFTDDR